MRMNKKMLAVTAILAVGILAGCGAAGSGSTASSAQSSSVSASSTVSSAASAQTDAVEPLNTGIFEELQTASFKFAAAIHSIKDGQVNMTVYSYDAYEQSDIDALQTGDVIRTHDGQTGKLVDVTVNSIEKKDDDIYVVINGGVEEGGLELTRDRDTYRTMTMDDYPVYYEAGELTLPLAEDAQMSDSSSAPDADISLTEGAAAVEEAFNNSENNYWNCTNTTVFTDQGKVGNIVRVWVP